MQVIENPAYTRDYLDPEKRSIANAVQVFFDDGTSTERVELEYPVGHRRRRDEALPLLRGKFEQSVKSRLSAEKTRRILKVFSDPAALDAMPVDQFMSLFTR